MPSMILISVQSLTLVANAAGNPKKPCLCLLHGWPQSRAVYDSVIDELANDFFVLAFDLPSIGASIGMPPSAEKSVLADILLAGAESAGAENITVAGVDIGGMIAFSAARDHGARIESAIVMNTVLPGIEPWSKVITDPRIWHFAFHAVPELPELLVRGRQRHYFDFFVDALSCDPKRISPRLREDFARAYERPESLATGFNWYRALAEDAKRNARMTKIDVPILYLRGDADERPIDHYVKGLQASGANNLVWRVVHDSGELIPVEAPKQFIQIVRDFKLRKCADDRDDMSSERCKGTK
jgi:pimeloyl-ACP methyl ester carboxylesterase